MSLFIPYLVDQRWPAAELSVARVLERLDITDLGVQQPRTVAAGRALE